MSWREGLTRLLFLLFHLETKNKLGIENRQSNELSLREMYVKYHVEMGQETRLVSVLTNYVIHSGSFGGFNEK